MQQQRVEQAGWGSIQRGTEAKHSGSVKVAVGFRERLAVSEVAAVLLLQPDEQRQADQDWSRREAGVKRWVQELARQSSAVAD